MTYRRMNKPLLVVYHENPEGVVQFFSDMGLEFQTEKHGEGLTHWACQQGDYVLEVYRGNKTTRFDPDYETESS